MTEDEARGAEPAHGNKLARLREGMLPFSGAFD
jgi:hypothetical protein